MEKEEITNFNLTGRERDILSILWNADRGMIASEIVNVADYHLTINTVQAVLKKLLKRKLVKVDRVVYSGTVLSRSYVPTVTEAEFETKMISSCIHKLNRFSISPVKYVMGFLCEEEGITQEEANELMELIQKITEEKKE